MFFHIKELQYEAKPERADPIYARRLQELLGGKFGEMTVMMSYLFQGWNCRSSDKYRDMLLDIGTEEIAHVEMLSIMIARLLDKVPVEEQERAAKHPAVGAALGGTRVDWDGLAFSGMMPQHEIVSGQGGMPIDSMGNPWSGAFATASGNLMADFRWNLMAETQGNLQVSRLYNMTDDTGVRNMLAFNLARDIMHQNQWQAAIEELEADGLHKFHVPSPFPLDRALLSQMHTFWNLSQGNASKEGRWASGPTPDGMGTFEYLEEPAPLSTDLGLLTEPDPRLDARPSKPTPVEYSGPNPVEDQEVPATVNKAAVDESKKMVAA
jgi:Mn-containing catalase